MNLKHLTLQKFLIIQMCARQYDVPLALALAIAYKESRFQSGLKGEHGDSGMFQVTKPAYNDVLNLLITPCPFAQCVEDRNSAKVGIAYLMKLRDHYRYGKSPGPTGIKEWATHYNCGPGIDIPDASEAYGKAVLAYYDKFCDWLAHGEDKQLE